MEQSSKFEELCLSWARAGDAVHAELLGSDQLHAWELELCTNLCPFGRDALTHHPHVQCRNIIETVVGSEERGYGHLCVCRGLYLPACEFREFHESHFRGR